MQRHKVVFFGDSITDCGHHDGCLGDGYVSIISKAYSDKYDIINSGVSGDTTSDLLRRMDKDVVAHNPYMVFLFVGTNDIWRRFRLFTPSVGDDEFASNYGILVDSIRAICDRLVLVKPYLVESDSLSVSIKGHVDEFRTELAGKGAIIDSLVHRAIGVVELDSIFARLDADNTHLTIDGIHPTYEGHEIIAYHLSRFL